MPNITAESDQTPRRSGLLWGVAVIAVIALGFVAANIFLHRTNLALQEELAQRQQFINESIRLSRLNTELVQALATVAAQTNDQVIRDLLASHGITFTVNLSDNSSNNLSNNDALTNAGDGVDE